MFETLLVSQDEISKLNDDADRNIAYMLVTRLVSQDEISALKVAYVEQYAPPSVPLESYRLNKYDMSSTSPVHHALMCPYASAASVALLHHAATAVRRVLVLKMYALSKEQSNVVGAEVVGAEVVVGSGVGSGVGSDVGAGAGSPVGSGVGGSPDIPVV